MRRLQLIALAAIAACGTRHEVSDGEVALASDPAATAVMRSSSGERVGTLSLVAQRDGRLRVTGTLERLPAGAHGIHLHAMGRCEGPDFESAGGHFNPTGKSHGLENPDGPHAGDAPNIQADANGRAPVDLVLAGASLIAGNRGYIGDADGAAIVVHASLDDQRTDPSGSSGARIACGVVGAP